MINEIYHFDKEQAKSSLLKKGNSSPTDEDILIEVIRRFRNSLLSQTDWWCVSDRTATAEQLAYRQALRDLPANCTPALDENGNLINVNWPEPPTE